MSAITPRVPPKCAHCETIQTLPEWSESMRENETTRFWRCMTCGYEFETTDHFVEPQPSNDELAEEFLPNLVVE
jgi:Zn ribbon nucleic-acid-binding protein